MKTPYLALVIGLAFSLPVTAGVYVYTDEQGNQVYTDSPPDNKPAEMVDVPHTNTLETPPDQKQKNEDFFKDLKQQQDTATNEREAYRQGRAAAKGALDKAQKNLKQAKVIVAGDMYPNGHGGVRYTEQYTNRVEAAERAVKDAKAAYDESK
ncbi:Uncharacterised protein [BD1-7 clade bacterium]|uniref:DUF4124 domain-containing protein n=1 Tax=BD1-7 clade bacterium TaxID=2029982 RepID=A0A5S9N6I1_9GAMM|nr:Uncharacterised protein [BD1-7 clade bacterium]CAA0085503.1 Uncharacterised protein [BD1-7 clade bacterium]